MAGVGERDLVCVVGAAGFVGSHVVGELLTRGLRVRATARWPERADEVAHLRALADERGAAARLELVGADPTAPGSLDAVVRGCRFVIAVASSTLLQARDPQREIVDVAVGCVRNVFDAVERAGSVERVVMTSSISAIVDETRPTDAPFDERQWNESATLATPYPLSKTLAEREAWRRAEAHGDGGPSLVTLQPTLVLGPLLARRHARTSPSLVLDLARGRMPMVPRFHIGVIDVRDVAIAHVEAMLRPAASGRYLVDGRGVWLSEIAARLRALRPGGRAPRRRMPNGLLYLAALFDRRLSWAFLRANLDVERTLDWGKARRELGIRPRALDQTLEDTLSSAERLGLL